LFALLLIKQLQIINKNLFCYCDVLFLTLKIKFAPEISGFLQIEAAFKNKKLKGKGGLRL